MKILIFTHSSCLPIKLFHDLKFNYKIPLDTCEYAFRFECGDNFAPGECNFPAVNTLRVELNSARCMHERKANLS